MRGAGLASIVGLVAAVLLAAPAAAFPTLAISIGATNLGALDRIG